MGKGWPAAERSAYIPLDLRWKRHIPEPSLSCRLDRQPAALTRRGPQALPRHEHAGRAGRAGVAEAPAAPASVSPWTSSDRLSGGRARCLLLTSSRRARDGVALKTIFAGGGDLRPPEDPPLAPGAFSRSESTRRCVGGPALVDEMLAVLPSLLRRPLLCGAEPCTRAMPSITVSTLGSEVAGRWPAWRCARAIAAARRRIVETASPRLASEVT